MTISINLHDWTLVGIAFDWEAGGMTINLKGPTGHRTIKAIGTRSISLDRKRPWGNSVSINGTTGPIKTQDGLLKFSIEMQSGDPIEIVAEHFALT